ncbi:hypothetical protein TPA0907_41930 [Micromonospora humidisoli]|nr:hypothetical protein TPA0907_41930 [Micromonospora sp. AKA109]
MPYRPWTDTALLPARDGLTRFAHQIMAEMPRADQRRWGETYIRGLLLGNGRRSVRSIAEGADVPDAVQSLQQFVNQSPWDWAPVRRRTARYVDEHMTTHAWLIRPIYIPKRGGQTAGVARRYVPRTGRTLNCQYGLGLFLSDAETSAPVDWRLVLPSPAGTGARSWLPGRREVGPSEQSEWCHVLAMADDVAAAVPVRPLVVGLRHVTGVERLLQGLRQRGLPFVVEVNDSMPVLRQLAPSSLPGGARPGLTQIRSLVQETTARRQPVMWRQLHDAALHRSYVTTVPVRLPGTVAGSGGGADCLLVAVWSAAATSAANFWLTGLPESQVGHVLTLAQLAARRERDVDTLSEGYGLLDFEGRSSRGWHHHMTLVSAAYAFAQLGTCSQQQEQRVG